MTSVAGRRLPAVRSLYEMIPHGSEGGKEFSRIVNLLLFHDARRSGRVARLFDDSAGDFHGLDCLLEGNFREEGTDGYQYKFYPSPLSAKHRTDIEESLARAADSQSSLSIKHWTLVTPHDFIESSRRKDGGDVTWFDSLKTQYEGVFTLEHWGHTQLLALFLESSVLCLYYYPELVDEGKTHRKTITDTRTRYDKNLLTMYRDLQFVGMSVYKQEASRGVAIDEIYIPLTIISEGLEEEIGHPARINPLTLLESGANNVILGDPGSGKSTLLQFLALSGMSRALQERYHAKPDKRLPVFVVLRKYADELRRIGDLSLLDYIIQSVGADFSLRSADLRFFEYYFETGQAILFFDGLDELPSPHFKEIVRDRIRSLLLTYPGNTSFITSRIVGYDNPFRFDDKEFRHFRLSSLQLPEIEQFVRDWYRVRIENKAEGERNVADLTRIIRDDDHVAIRQLAENPLLLTIVALVHRIDAVLPDERVVLYQKCTETLLNTWHTWKARETEQRNRGKMERRNRARMEAIAHWMQCNSDSASESARAVSPYQELHQFLVRYISESERPGNSDQDPQDSATDFLDFVRRKAGLLIEAGDQRYSFVHLTFQEYLTATYIMTSNEAGGAEGIWSIIQKHYRDPRWHEVIRLLMAALKSRQTQEVLLQNLLNADADEDVRVAELLGGFVLDAIEPAEERVGEIVPRVLGAVVQSMTADDCRRTLRIIQAGRRKDSFSSIALERGLEELLAATKKDSTLRVAPFVIASACGVSDAWITRCRASSHIEECAEGYFYDLLFHQETPNPPPSELLAHFDHFADYVGLCAVTSPSANRAAALMVPIFWRAGYSIAARYSFRLILSSFIGGIHAGPFTEFSANMMRNRLPITATGSGSKKMDSIIFKGRNEPKLLGRQEKDVARLQDALGMVWKGKGEETDTLWMGRECLQQRVYKRSNGDKLFDLVESAPGRPMRSAVDGAVLYPQALSLLTRGIPLALNLKPAPVWECVLGYENALSASPNPWPTTRQLVSRLKDNSSPVEATDADAFCLATHLLIDLFCKIYSISKWGISTTLLGIADEMNHPAVKLSNTLRALALNDATDPTALMALTRDYKCRTFMDEAGWPISNG